MRLILCGTAAGPFTARRASSGYVLRAGHDALMLDCGPGSVREVLRAGIAVRDLGAVMLSHLHQDHYLDLAAIAFQALYGRYESLPLVLGPPGTQETALRLMEMRRTSHAVPKPQVTETGDDDEREVCGFEVRAVETPHTTGLIALARRIEREGRALVFSGDTRANPEGLVPLSLGADLLLHECFSRSGLERYAAASSDPERVLRSLSSSHTEVSEAARIARDANVRRLVLTHLLPTEDEKELRRLASAVFGGELVIARDGLHIDF